MEKPKLDLNPLAIDRTAAKPDRRGPDLRGPDRRWLMRYLVPGSLLLGFAALVMTAAGTQFLPFIGYKAARFGSMSIQHSIASPLMQVRWLPIRVATPLSGKR